MHVLDMTIIRLAAGLVLLIAANIALGSINAIIAGDWDKSYLPAFSTPFFLG